jgi:hypothetical protein
MAPRETFDNVFLDRNEFNILKDHNIDYKHNMDLTVDYEMNTFSPTQTQVPPSMIGDAIKITPLAKNVTNDVLGASEEIIPPLSRADVPLVDLMKIDYSGYSNAIKEYMTKIGKYLMDLYAMMSKNDAINGIFKDNIKIISVLIAVAAGSFIVNAGISAIAVGLILMLVTKNASKLF